MKMFTLKKTVLWPERNDSHELNALQGEGVALRETGRQAEFEHDSSELKAGNRAD